jgi:hypothetical protein
MHALLQCVKFDDSSLSYIVWFVTLGFQCAHEFTKPISFILCNIENQKKKKKGQWNYYKNSDIISKLIIHWRNVKWLIRNLVISKIVNKSTNIKSMKSIRLVVVLDYCKIYIYKTTEICRLAAKTFKNKNNNKSIKSITLGKVHDYYTLHF